MARLPRRSFVAILPVCLALLSVRSLPAQEPYVKPRVVEPVEPVEPAPTDARLEMVKRAYTDGRARAGRTGYLASSTPWQTLAYSSGLGYDELVRSWEAIWIAHHAYRTIVNRQPSVAEIRTHAGQLASGATWESIWRAVAMAPEREQKLGFFAPVAFDSPEAAKQAFSLPFVPRPEQCFGGLGDKCEGGIPNPPYDRVQPRWFGEFVLPNGTRMAMVEIGVAVGSIMHDNACNRDHSGLNCSGIGAGDLVKTGSWPAAREWNKAAWNVIDDRNWRATFGPYPVDKTVRRERWYDDLRLVQNREGWMAPVLSMITIPEHTDPYTMGETKASLRLAAPGGTSLDSKDVAFCQSKIFRERGSFPLKAPWGICQ